MNAQQLTPTQRVEYANRRIAAIIRGLSDVDDVGNIIHAITLETADLAQLAAELERVQKELVQCKANLLASLGKELKAKEEREDLRRQVESLTLLTQQLNNQYEELSLCSMDKGEVQEREERLTAKITELEREIEGMRDKLGRNTGTSFWVDSYYAVKSERDDARVACGQLRHENEQLKLWKASALANTPPLQEIATALGLPLGVSIPDKILPGIRVLNHNLEQLRAAADRAVNETSHTVRDAALENLRYALANLHHVQAKMEAPAG